jgi:hypothetical protein
MKRILLLVLVILIVGVIALSATLRHPKPAAGETGAAADELARAIGRNVHLDAWEATGAVRWTFAGMDHHLWDRRRNLARVEWKNLRVLVDLGKVEGRAWRGGTEVTGDERARLVKDAYARWCNDSFWLNPLAKLFDAGVTRMRVSDDDGQPALLVQYSSGGVTPGDSYLWLLDKGGRPRAWRMWVSVIPVGGIETSWEKWQTLATGADVATAHKVTAVTLKLDDVVGARTLAELEPQDPFAPLSAP